MDIIFTDLDSPLADFTYDYINGNMSEAERMAYEEYLSTDKPLTLIVNQAKKARQALQNAYQVQAADDFEEKLFKRIAQDKEEDKSEENYTSV